MFSLIGVENTVLLAFENVWVLWTARYLCKLWPVFRQLPSFSGYLIASRCESLSEERAALLNAKMLFQRKLSVTNAKPLMDGSAFQAWLILAVRQQGSLDRVQSIREDPPSEKLPDKTLVLLSFTVYCTVVCYIPADRSKVSNGVS